MKAQLVFDGEKLIVPEAMGTAKENQLQGSKWEQLGELASRICYDSLGKGRSSEELHKHIVEVKNLSVYEHIVFTVGVYNLENYQCLLNRKGVFVHEGEVTINLRAIIEWERHSMGFNNNWRFGETLKALASEKVPMIVQGGTMYHDATIIPGDKKDQVWISMYLKGSRGFSHEQVRHRFAMSQRSTRYVDESDSEYIDHPLLIEFMRDEEVKQDDKDIAANLIGRSMMADRACYTVLVNMLEKYGEKKGLDKLSARKQARGTARGYLGNALSTEMIFSAPISGWQWMIKQRLSPLADAEIREIYKEVVKELEKSPRCSWALSFE